MARFTQDTTVIFVEDASTVPINVVYLIAVATTQLADPPVSIKDNKPKLAPLRLVGTLPTPRH